MDEAAEVSHEASNEVHQVFVYRELESEQVNTHIDFCQPACLSTARLRHACAALAPRPRQVRWYSYRAAFTSLKDAARTTEVAHRGSVLRFCAADSLALEAAYQAQVGAAARGARAPRPPRLPGLLWKTPSDLYLSPDPTNPLSKRRWSRPGGRRRRGCRPWPPAAAEAAAAAAAAARPPARPAPAQRSRAPTPGPLS